MRVSQTLLFAALVALGGSSAFAKCTDWQSPRITFDRGITLVSEAMVEMPEGEVFDFETPTSGKFSTRSADGTRARFAIFVDRNSGFTFLVPRTSDRIEAIKDGKVFMRSMPAIALNDAPMPDYLTDYIQPHAKMSCVVNARSTTLERRVRLIDRIRGGADDEADDGPKFVTPPETIEDTPPDMVDSPLSGPETVWIDPKEGGLSMIKEGLDGATRRPLRPEADTPSGLSSITGAVPAAPSETPSLNSLAEDLAERADIVALPIAPSVEDAVPSPPPVTAARVNACSATDGGALDWFGAAPETPYSVSGIVKQTNDLVGYELIPQTGDIIPTPIGTGINDSAREMLTRIWTPFGLRPREIGAPDPAVFVGLPDLPAQKSAASAAMPEAAPPALINILVVGDPRAMTVAGLAELDKALLSEFGAAPWTVTWARADPSGSFAPLTRHASLSALGEQAKLETGEFFARTADLAKAYLDNLAGVLAAQPTQVDLVVILLEGQVWPPQTPVLFDTFLEAVERSGNVPRLGKGETRKWLLVASGYTDVSFSLAYLAGPIATSGKGVFLSEQRSGGGTRTTFFSDMDAAVSAVRSPLTVAARNAGFDLNALRDNPGIGSVDDAAFSIPIIYPRGQVVSEVGLLISAAEAPTFIQSLQLVNLIFDKTIAGPGEAESNTIDTVALVQLNSDETGGLRPRPLSDSNIERSLTALKKTPVPDFESKAMNWHEATLRNMLEQSFDGCSHIYVSVSAAFD
ncbi:MAG: hypothetical protein AAF307_02345 [Pseudomonadota bacterium]